MGLKSFWAGFIFCVLLIGCAGAFVYRDYEMNGVSFKDGKLLGPSAADDKNFSECQPTADNANPCIVMFTAEFLALKQDYLDIQSQLNACQHGVGGVKSP